VSVHVLTFLYQIYEVVTIRLLNETLNHQRLFREAHSDSCRFYSIRLLKNGPGSVLNQQGDVLAPIAIKVASNPQWISLLLCCKCLNFLGDGRHGPDRQRLIEEYFAGLLQVCRVYRKIYDKQAY